MLTESIPSCTEFILLQIEWTKFILSYCILFCYKMTCMRTEFHSVDKVTFCPCTEFYSVDKIIVRVQNYSPHVRRFHSVPQNSFCLRNEFCTERLLFCRQKYSACIHFVHEATLRYNDITRGLIG